MAITGSDLVWRLTTKSGSAGDSTSSTPAGSLGKYVSTTVVTDATLQNLFDNVTGAEASAGSTEYRAVALLNNHATLTYQSASVTIASQTALGGTITIALDNIAVSAKGSASAQGAEITNETTAPTGVGTFGAGPLTIGDIAAGSVKIIWLKRVVSASTAGINPDGVILECSGDTLP